MRSPGNRWNGFGRTRRRDDAVRGGAFSPRALKVAAAASGVGPPVSEEDHPPSREWYGGEECSPQVSAGGCALDGAQPSLREQGVRVADEMGLGKTAQSLH